MAAGDPRRHDARMASAQTDAVGPVRRVMVGTDRSETAARAVEWAASFAERFGAELHVVQVIVPQHAADTEYCLLYTSPSPRD